LNPVFNEEFFCPVAHYTEGIIFNVMDRDVYIDEHLGKYFLPVSELIKPVNDDDMDKDLTLAPGDLKRVGLHKIVKLSSAHKIVKAGTKKIRDYGTLEFMIEFIPTRLLPKTPEVPGLYFSPTKCNDVKLYMNADDDGSAPVVRYGGQNDDEKVWKPPRMWRDVYDAICNAEQFIYLVGWSFDTDQYLLRGEELTKELAQGKYSPRLGELLLDKAEEGVVVNLMQWDDFSSNAVQQTGKMGTCDEKTKNFFRGTKVNARFMGMAGGETNTVLQGTSKRMVFTHHQKFIIMDAPRVDDDDDDKSPSKRMNKSQQLLHGGKRELLAFVGGIDLTTGRWDNRQVCSALLVYQC
jgi:phospholipase D1/2